MEKSVQNAVFKGFPVLMESDTFGSKQNSQTTNKETNNSLSSFFRVYYLVSECTGKRVADRSAVDTALGLIWILFSCKKCVRSAKVCSSLFSQPHVKSFIYTHNYELYRLIGLFFYLQVSVMTLPKGLYACYVQSFTTVDSGHGLNVVVSNSSPSVLPYAKVRDNPHVTSEEWAWVRSQKHILRWASQL